MQLTAEQIARLLAGQDTTITQIRGALAVSVKVPNRDIEQPVLILHLAHHQLEWDQAFPLSPQGLAECNEALRQLSPTEE